MDGMDIFAPAGIRLISAVHDQGGGHMADGRARARGRDGVIVGQNGPGISGAVTAIAAAYRAHSPVVVITPETGTPTPGLDGLQEAQQSPMFEQSTEYQGHVASSRRVADVTTCSFERAGDRQMNGGRTAMIQIMCTRDLGGPFRRDAPARPARFLDKCRDDT